MLDDFRLDHFIIEVNYENDNLWQNMVKIKQDKFCAKKMNDDMGGWVLA